MSWAVIGVPIDSVGRSGGTELAPAALREHGIVERLGATDRGDLNVAIRGDARDPDTGVIGIDGVLATTIAVRAAVAETVAAGGRPLLLGGCCTLVPGALAGLRDTVGAHGVAYVDGHVDVYDGRTSPTGEAADMPMGVAFGLGPQSWVEAAGGPTTAPADVIVLGARDPEEAEDIAGLLAGPLSELTVLGPTELDGAPVPGQAVLDPPRRRRARRARDARDRLPDARRAGLGRAGRADGAAGRLAGARRPQPRLREPGEGPGRHLSRADVLAARGSAGRVSIPAWLRRLDGTVALVTGASSGIGEAAAKALARQGAKVAVAARRRDRLEALAQEIGALVIEADITDREQAIGAVERTVSELGRLDTVINNAGVMLLGQAEGSDLDEWERMVAINVQGLLYVAHAAIEPLLQAAQDGPRGIADMVNISSIAGRVARRGSGVYNLTKHGVGAFSESLRQEFATRHLRVSLVEPGAVATELTDHMKPEARDATRNRFKDIERLEAEDIGEIIEFIVTRPRRTAINEVMVRPTNQEW